MTTHKTRLATLALGLAVMATPVSAAGPHIKCDAWKTKAASKGFAAILKCLHANYADLNFDEVTCITAAKDRMIAGYAAADVKYGASCSATGNGAIQADAVAGFASTLFNSL